ncbi:hypothetical protein AAF712_009070 [Marasmius tenuissimus]|uniref:F-box domain-containing protein n=1 Tax=Marasmius tenuissimus TaxID=585030 RepID=A0ABR2ZUK3_9AGAR|nr:hypothetical protein PM082_002015 [Marasmius tenuissimus]
MDVYGSNVVARKCTLDGFAMNVDTPQASINTIPVEILTEIFGYFLPKGNALDSPIPPLVTFVSVCRHWRQASLNAPYLWSTIRLYNPRPSRIQMLRQWLERSKACPLTLMLEITPFSSGDRAEWKLLVNTMEEALSVLILHLHRWKSVDLHLEDFPILVESPLLMLGAYPGAAPLLEEVCIAESQSFTLDAGQSIWRAIGTYPGVQRVVWQTNLAGPRSCLSGNVGWNRITYLNSHFILDDDFLGLLSHSHALEHLHISRLETSSLPILPRSRFCLPQLRKLYVMSSTTSATTLFLDHIETPLLEYLQLGEWHSGQAWVEMFERSSCRLKALWVCDKSFSDEASPKWFLSSALECLEELVAVLWCPADTLLRLLTWQSDVRRLPLLQKMKMSAVAGFTGGLLETMLASRLQNSSSNLRDLSLTFGPARMSRELRADMCYLKTLRENGFNVTYD